MFILDFNPFSTRMKFRIPYRLYGKEEETIFIYFLKFKRNSVKSLVREPCAICNKIREMKSIHTTTLLRALQKNSSSGLTTAKGQELIETD